MVVSRRWSGRTRYQFCHGKLSFLNNIDLIICCCTLCKFWTDSLNSVPTKRRLLECGDGRMTTGKKKCIFARRLFTYMHARVFHFSRHFLHPRFRVHVEYSVGAKTLHSQYLLGWKSVPRCCLELIMFFVFFSILHVAYWLLDFFLFSKLHICCASLSIFRVRTAWNNNLLKEMTENENSQTKQRF